jgi:ubiquitin-activating enzyme E1 C
LPEHCIQYCYIVEWEQEFGQKAVDKDSPEDMTWIYKKALARSEKYGISGVTYNLTMGVVKNIIPAIASTNAIISAACITEVIKILSGCNKVLDNYMQYMGQTGVTTTTYVSAKEDECMVCNVRTFKITASKSQKLREIFDKIKSEDANFQRTSFNTLHNGEILYIPHPPNLE